MAFERLSILTGDADRAALLAGVEIWRVTEIEWFAARSPKDAIAAYREFAVEMMGLSECEIKEALEFPVVMLTDEQMDHYRYRDDDFANTVSFREQLVRMVERGEKFPCFFASSEY